MTFKYSYTYRLGDGGALLRMPIVRVVFTNPKNKKQVEVGCLIDSGADDLFLNTRLADVLRHSVAGASAVQPLITGKVGVDGGAQTFKDFGSPERYAKIFVELGIAKKPPLPRRGGHGLVSTPVSVYIPERTRMAQLASEQRCCS